MLLSSTISPGNFSSIPSCSRRFSIAKSLCGNRSGSLSSTLVFWVWASFFELTSHPMFSKIASHSTLSISNPSISFPNETGMSCMIPDSFRAYDLYPYSGDSITFTCFASNGKPQPDSDTLRNSSVFDTTESSPSRTQRPSHSCNPAVVSTRPTT
ncbi:unnamed protein product [Chondrus crispus]|uniref:Uncharacterized protein n=1 Tax=Chondrus crispus TaxID=2769 RepID=R7QFV0_CHOCR|nr:unnamed protein product [Chondrus crispus]CDF36331.1 unnamed protein product [Chondrus crispus]|eukprot:XP_005716150.1 unnamed protein product [Chondrus crispus]